MHKVWLIIKREYMEKVRTRSFLISTLAMPAIIAVFLLPGKLAMMKMSGTRQLVVVAADRSLGEAIQHELEKPARTGDQEGESARDLTGRYKVQISGDLSDAERTRLRDQVAAKKIDGYLWIGDEQVADRKVIYVGRDTSDFMNQGTVRSAVRNAFVVRAMAEHGISPEQVEDVLAGARLEVVQLEDGQEKKVNTGTAFASAFGLVMLLYTTVLFYGIAIMRSVVEEKSSRVLEVLLSSVTARELMIGKIVGVGAVGLTQVALWASMIGVIAAPGAFAADFFRKAHISPLALAGFVVFFLLGYLLYATMYAALGAMVNTEQEGQQLQMVIMMPLILAISLIMLVIRDPNGAVATWTSMIPFVAPVLMYLRIVVQTPPMWQIGLCVALLAGTIWGLLLLCSRIYRVGILMYGKRATLPEILKWIKYADT